VSAFDLITTVAVAALVLYLLYLSAFDRFNLVIAFRNVFRNVRRSTITILAIALGGAAVIVFGGFINDMYYGLRESTIRSQLGHVQLYRGGVRGVRAAGPRGVPTLRLRADRRCDRE
jgi:putative ABC transport system permease protein